MRDYKNIDRIFQERLKDFEVLPPNKSWDFIEKRIVARPKRRRLSFWLRLSSIAAIFILLFSVGTIYFMPDSNFLKNFYTEEPTVTLEIKKPSITTKIPIKLEENSTVLNKNVALPIIKNSDTHKTLINTEKVTENLAYEDNNEAPSSTISLGTEKPKTASYKKNKKSLIDLNKPSKFTVATIFAPIYINSFGEGSGVDAQFKNNPTSGNSSYSYGVKFAYAINDKFSIQSGVNLINLGYTTTDVYINSGQAVVGFSNISSQPIFAKNENALPSKSRSINLFESNKGNLNQVFGYVEIPIELKYSVTNGKFGIDLVGGFSTLLLNNDEVFIETGNFSQSLGSSNNLRSVNFSGNIGVDIDYLLHKNLYINVSPMFKMQTNTFSKNAGSILPYYLGVYTGLNYKF